MSGISPSEAPDELVGRVQELQERLDAAGDPATRELADELVSAIVQMYGAGLERIVAAARRGGDGRRCRGRLADDPLVATLLMIHDLHPVPLEERVHEALEQVRPYMESHGGNVELLALSDGVARIRLEGSCSDCSASTVTLELAIKQALEEAAPDLEGLEVEGIEPAPPSRRPRRRGSDRLPLAEAPAPAWFEVSSVDALPAGGCRVAEVGGSRLVVANVDGTLLAYRDACAGCGGPLHDGELDDGALRCPACARIYFLPRAGRSMDDDRLQLEPVPLLARPRHGEGGAGDVSGDAEALVARQRGERCVAGFAAAAAPAGRRGRRRDRRALRHLRHRPARRPPPSAAAGRAADRVRLRELLGAPLGRCRVPADRQPDRLAAGRSSFRTTSGRRFQIPIGLAFFMDSTTAGCVVALYPSPAGRPRASCTSRPGAGWSS